MGRRLGGGIVTGRAASVTMVTPSQSGGHAEGEFEDRSRGERGKGGGV